jgi:two-component system, cell cycle response regulator DivK
MRVLVVDDHPVNRALVHVFLGDSGCSVVDASGAQEALELLSQSKFDAVLLDVSMPGMSGEEACDVIRANPATRDLRVVAYTAHALNHERESLMARGFDEVLTKPITKETLLTAIRYNGSVKTA